jgi:hypothetical protein
MILARPQIADPAKAEVMFDYAIAALAVGHTVVDRLLDARWSTVRDALAADATRGPEVAVACGLESDEVAVGEQLGGPAEPRRADVKHGVPRVVLLARGVRRDR